MFYKKNLSFFNKYDMKIIITQDQDSKEVFWQEWKPLHVTEPGAVHIPGIQERADRLISKFKGKSDKPPKVNTQLRRFIRAWFVVLCH